MQYWNDHDPFETARRQDGTLDIHADGETIPLVLRHSDVRQAAKDWETFSSDAPFRVPIPAETAVRSVRQLPIETDPPAHSQFRALVNPFFRRPRSPEMAAQVQDLIDELLDHAFRQESVEVVHEFALPLQSRALTLLLGMPMSEAEEWISWGTSMFYDENVAGDEKGNMLHQYLERQFDRAASKPGDDFFSALSQAEIDGRPLNRAEMLGFGNLAFAGGRDTVITVVSFALAHLASSPGDLASLRDNPKLTISATEEIVRVSSPLTMIGRQCPHGTSVHGHPVQPGSRAALCWASANRDETIFEDPKSVRLDRSPNPHFGFGSGIHSCLGANQARLILRTLLERVSHRASTLTVQSLVPHMEKWPEYQRQVGYEKLEITFDAR
ncbi:MAG: cytochrome P450 [Xanthomonadales bacterium]|nr:cytochrome P450 [Xanthomonadales bacterium]